jgi:aconitate hydratase
LVSRARRHGGGFLVAGLGFGEGAEREQAALIPVALGIRVVLARSFDPGFRRQLVNAGVLPLRLRVEADYRTLAPGDELEVPALPESLQPGRPIEVRNLTRGIQHTLPHDLDARETVTVRAGGLLRSLSSAALAAEARS